VRALRVALLADFLEERWPSMDLVADMLFDHLRREHTATVAPVLVRPRMRPRFTRLTSHSRGLVFDRVANRLWDYPRVAARLRDRFDVFHVVDHSYAQLVHELPRNRTLVTCHDTDTFRSVLQPGAEARSAAFRAMARRILRGLTSAAHIACDSSSTRDALVGAANIDPDRTSIVYNGAHPSCGPGPDANAERLAAEILDQPGSVDLLHVGSTIERKRIDLLLRIVARVRATNPSVRLIRAGGPFTPEQTALAQSVGLSGHIVVLPGVDRATLAAIYRRSALVLLPSEREGFGLPLIEALACGTPVVASDIASLREVGGAAVTYCGLGDLESWRDAVLGLLEERRNAADRWTRRREAGITWASAFSWSGYANQLVSIYRRIAPVTEC
jgi:glycosyltransferase involved in cell wall biosynthesis